MMTAVRYRSASSCHTALHVFFKNEGFKIVFFFCQLFISFFLQTCPGCHCPMRVGIVSKSAGCSVQRTLMDGWMEVTIQAQKAVLSCTVTTDSFPASCCGMLKVSSVSPKES